MRDVLGTIQADQDAIIRAESRGTLVVDGGPGTGKTVVALHRAAYLLYTYRQQLERRGVLVVGPNSTFLRYIGEVLPALGETAVVLAPSAPGGGTCNGFAEPVVTRGESRLSLIHHSKYSALAQNRPGGSDTD